jgi:DNA adenine methylase
MDIVKVGLELKLNVQWFDRLFPAFEIRKAGDSALLVMTVDPLYTVPWFLLARDLKKGGVKVVYYGPTEGKLNTRYIYDWMREVEFIAVSNYVRDKLVEAGLKVVDVVHHGVDLKVIDQARKMKTASSDYFSRYGLDPSKHLIVTTVANSHPRKGLAWYDKVVEEVGRKDGSIKFLVITEDKGLTYFKRRPNLVVTTGFGKLPRLTILSIIANSHILAIPSLSEGFGLPVLEAMALGTPVIHAELPPLMEFSTGVTVPVKEVRYFDKSEVGPTGIIYEQHLWDPKEFAEVLLQLVDIYRNHADVIVDWRYKSWFRAKKFSIYKTYPKLLKYFFNDIPTELDDGVGSYEFSKLLTIPPPAPPLNELEIVEVPQVSPTSNEVVEVDELDLNVVSEELLRHTVESVGSGKLTKPLSYPGGDWFIKDEILDLLVKSKCRTLVEVFGGSGVISMYAPRDVFKNIVYNDIDSLLVNFFTVLKERPEELQKRLILMPVSRELTEKYIEMLRSGEIHKLDPVEKASIYYYLIRNTFSSTLGGFKTNVLQSTAHRFRRSIARLVDYAKLWVDVTIENKDFRELIKQYDRDYVVFYCDPPYLSVPGIIERDFYIHRFTENDMKDLLNILSSIKGKFVLKLQDDQLKISFIKEWVDKNKYNVKVVEHSKSLLKVIGGKRPKFKTVLIYNFSG